MDDLSQVMRGDIDAAEATRQKYSQDASIFEVKPEAVLYPKDEADLSALIKHVTKRRQEGVDVSLTARNGGTCMSGGSLTESYVVDMSRYFTKVSEIDFAKSSITVQGGVMHKKVEEATHPHKLLFPPYTSSHDICGVGGMIGNNASGEKSIKYGATSKNIRKLKVMLSDGNTYEFGPVNAAELEEKMNLPTYEGKLYREMFKMVDDNWGIIQTHHPKVKKNAAGYALWELWDREKGEFNLGRIFVGAQGTLGITTEAELNLIPFAPYSRMIVVPISNLRDLAPVVQTMLKFEPETCETFDMNTYDLAKIHHPKEAQLAGIADGKHLLVFAMYAGNSVEESDSTAGKAKEALEQLGHTVEWITSQEVVDSFLLIRRKSFKLLLEHPHQQSRAMPFLEDTIVPIDHYGEFLAAMEVILTEYDMKYTYAGHIGDGSIRLVPLVDMERPGAAEDIMESGQRIYDLVFAFGGSMSVDHNDGLIRTPFLERMYGSEMVTLFAKTKELFDPLGIFNPGKKVGGSFDFTIDHIIRKNG